MKTTQERIRSEKQLWLDISKFFKHLGYTPKWEIGSQSLSRQKVWNRIDSKHLSGKPGLYGFAITIGRIGNHDLQFCLEMQDELRFGLRFKEGFPYWTEDEIQAWGELTLRLDNSGIWIFDTQGWFATRKLPVKLDFTDSQNPAALDLEYYKEDSYAKLLIVDDLKSCLNQVKSSYFAPLTKQYGTYTN